MVVVAVNIPQISLGIQNRSLCDQVIWGYVILPCIDNEV